MFMYIYKGCASYIIMKYSEILFWNHEYFLGAILPHKHLEAVV